MERTMQHVRPLEKTDWPTTLRFSRRQGEAVRDAEYAIAIESPGPRPLLSRALKRWFSWMRAKVVRLVFG
jgi:hypothetical protein